MTRTFVQRSELGESETKEGNEERGSVFQEFYEVIVRHGVIDLGKWNPSCLYGIRPFLRSRKATVRVGMVTLDMRMYSPPRRLYGLGSW